MRRASQSSGIITAPVTPRLKGKATLGSDDEESETEPVELTLVIRKKKDDNGRSPTPRASTPRPPTPHRGILKRSHDKASFEAHDRFSNHGAGYGYPPSSGFQPPPPSTSTPFRYSQYGMTGPLPANPGYQHHNQHQHHPYHGIPHGAGYPPQATHWNGLPNWVPPQTQVAPPYMNPRGYYIHQTRPMSALPNQPHPVPTFPYATSGPHPMSAQPPAPQWLPVMPTFQGPAITAPQGSYANRVKGIEDRPISAIASRARTSSKENKSKSQNGIGNDDAKDIERISQHVRHYHICAGCGKKRSKEYRRAHPLRRGEVPNSSYCTRCIEDAELSDSNPPNVGTARRGSSTDVSAFYR